ncbi:hypothetical protein [Agromyces bauzanensis]
MSIHILRVLGIRSKTPGVLAIAEGHMVRWDPRRGGWDCQCLTPADEYECEHIEAVRNLIDQRVTEPVKARTA